jgi:hypothetical protein
MKWRGVDCGVPRLPLKAVAANDNDRVRNLFDRIMHCIEHETVSADLVLGGKKHNVGGNPL